MKILLFGEFSGFMNSLKRGLTLLGHDVFLASNGDGFKNFPSDFRWDQHFQVKDCPNLNGIISYFNIWWHKDLLKGYDVVLFVDPNYLKLYRCLNDPVYKYIIKNNNKIYLSGSGDTKHVFDYWYYSDTKYHHYYEGYLINNPNFPYVKDKHNVKGWEDYLLSVIDGYIPIWYEYAEPFRNYPKLKKTIRIPIDINSQQYVPNIVKNDKVVFYHGINRECKGTRFIRKAFEIMEKCYSEHAEFIIAERLPFNEYMRVINKANVIVDDANSYSIAMNGLFSLLKGKIVMGGAEPVANKELGIDGVNPVFNINPDPEQICEAMKYIIDNRGKIEEWGLAGRKFVEKYHDCRDIAKQYEQVWLNDLSV